MPSSRRWRACQSRGSTVTGREQAPPPTRDGVPQWTVDIDVMVQDADWDWPPKVEHPAAEPLTSYGWGRGVARLHGPAPACATAALGRKRASRASAHRRACRRTFRAARRDRASGAREADDQRIGSEPRGPGASSAACSRCRRPRREMDGTTLTLASDRRADAFERMTCDERPDRVAITVHERLGPIWSDDGIPIASAGLDMLRLQHRADSSSPSPSANSACWTGHRASTR